MPTDSVTYASIHSAPNARDLGRKKKTRTAKLKQSKLDVRREQWLSQVAVKSKKANERVNGVVTAKAQMCKEGNRSVETIERRRTGGENERSIHLDSDFSESPSNSPTSHNSSVLVGSDSGIHFGCSGSCCSGSITEEEEGDDGCLDDWEAVADALAAEDKHQILTSESFPEHESAPQLASPHQSIDKLSLGVGDLKDEVARIIETAPGNSRAWRADDAFRPQSLPNLSKQLSLLNSNWNCGVGGISWGCRALSAPSSCPICYEDLDSTDSSFLPCMCGFRLCLFCHKRIVEDDGRCPGCRKPYDHDPVKFEPNAQGGSQMFRLARSFSMITRS